MVIGARPPDGPYVLEMTPSAFLSCEPREYAAVGVASPRPGAIAPGPVRPRLREPRVNDDPANLPEEKEWWIGIDFAGIEKTGRSWNVVVRPFFWANDFRPIGGVPIVVGIGDDFDVLRFRFHCGPPWIEVIRPPTGPPRSCDPAPPTGPPAVAVMPTLTFPPRFINSGVSRWYIISYGG